MAVGRRLALVLLLLLTAGCVSKQRAVAMRTGGDVMPVVEVKPGYVERIALMDEYRLHDEMRKHMMRRPHVTAEEVTEEDVEQIEEEEQPQAAGVTSASQ